MFGYSISDFIAKKVIDKIGNLKTLFYAQLFGVVFLLFYFLKDASLPVFSLKNIIYILLFGIFDTIGYLALYRSFEVGKLSIVSPISSSYVILTAIISYFFMGETFSHLKIISLVLVIIGIVLTSIDFKGLKNGLDKKDLVKGVPEAMLVFLIFGVYVPFWDKFLEGSGWIVWVILVRLIISAILFVYWRGVKKQSLSAGSNKLIFVLFLIALFEAFAAFGSSWGYHASVNTTSLVTAVSSAYPLITVTLAYLFLKERLAFSQYIGVGLIIGGLCISPFV